MNSSNDPSIRSRRLDLAYRDRDTNTDSTFLRVKSEDESLTDDELMAVAVEGAQALDVREAARANRHAR